MAKTRKQKLKVKDFQKKKLKVGKEKQKASNVTDTSFVSKTISIRNQHLGHDNDLLKRLPLLKHHNLTVRKETLLAFHKMIPVIINTRIMTPLLAQSIPLICDDSRQIRYALIDLINEIGLYDVQVLKLHCKVFLLYINMAMTHIVSSIQTDSTRFLVCLLKHCGEEICRQSFVKLLSGILSILGWGQLGKNQAAGAAQNSKRDSKQTMIHLNTLYELIKNGCTEPVAENVVDNTGHALQANPNQHLIPDNPQPYVNLKLFARELNSKENGTSSSSITSAATAISTQDVGARQRILKDQFLPGIERQLDSFIKDGGECGKSSNNLKQLLEEIFSDK